MSAQSAVIDRIVDDEHVVLLVGSEEIERIVPVTALPDGIQEGMWLLTEWSGDQLVRATIDKEKTMSAQQRVQAKMDLLRQRGRRL